MGQHLVVAHYHLRSGGVRRVIETTLPAIAGCGKIDKVTLAVGEKPDAVWLERLRESLRGTPLQILTHPGLGYVSEWKHPQEHTTRGLAEICRRWIGNANTILWLHNAALGRNLPASLAWAEAAKSTGAVIVSHHHDFFFDNRWHLWPEIQASGFLTPTQAAEAALSEGSRTVHVAINRADFAGFESGFRERAVWSPNAVDFARHEPVESSKSDFWILPTRMLRRKNVLEAVLLARWLRPDARLIITGGAGSANESAYAARIFQSAKRHQWKLDFSECTEVPVSAAMSSAECVLMTSLQEGFGLPYVEAASAQRPLLGRRLSNVLLDLVSLGLHAPNLYDDVVVPPDLFRADLEVDRQFSAWSEWRRSLPAELRSLCGESVFCSSSGLAVPFSRLTFDAQEEILAHSSEDLRFALAPLNPGLASMVLHPAHLDEKGRAAFSPESFGRRFHEAVALADSAPPPSAEAPYRALDFFLRERLASQNQYPLLFSTAV
jgi:hypothetical protein